MRINKTTGILLALLAAASLQQASAQTVSLEGTSYTNTFDTFEADFGPPTGWTTYRSATATSPGTIFAWTNGCILASWNSWTTTSGRFANHASTYSYIGLTNFLGTESKETQTNELNRCMGVRQTSGFGDPGAAFVLKIADTLNRKDFQLYVDFLSLDMMTGRSTTWTVDYGFGDTPSVFVPIATWANTVSNFITYRTNITFPNGTIDNNSGTVWIRIVALTGSTGAGNRPTSGIDNFGLTWAEGSACTPANVTSDPSPVNGYANGNASFSVGAVGTADISYQWRKNGSTVLTDDGHFGGTTTPTLSITTLQSSDAGTYSCLISNYCNSTAYTDTSAGANLTVTTPPAVSIGYLRSLVATDTWAPTNTTQLFTATGMITTLTNTTSGNTASYYLQDGTGGINLFCSFGSTFRPAIGDVVRAVGPLGAYQNNLELNLSLNNPAHSVTVLSNNIAAYPAAIVVPWDNLYQPGNNADLNYNVAGSIVRLENVYFGTNAGVVTFTNHNWVVTNVAGQFARVFIPAGQDADVLGRTIPAFATYVQGPLIPTATGYQVMPTRWSDIVEGTPPAPVGAVTINSITATTIAYSGGAGAKFILLQSPTVNAAMSTWTTTGQTNTATPGTFTVPGAGYYRIESK